MEFSGLSDQTKQWSLADSDKKCPSSRNLVADLHERGWVFFKRLTSPQANAGSKRRKRNGRARSFCLGAAVGPQLISTPKFRTRTESPESLKRRKQRRRSVLLRRQVRGRQLAKRISPLRLLAPESRHETNKGREPIQKVGRDASLAIGAGLGGAGIVEQLDDWEADEGSLELLHFRSEVQLGKRLGSGQNALHRAETHAKVRAKARAMRRGGSRSSERMRVRRGEQASNERTRERTRKGERVPEWKECVEQVGKELFPQKETQTDLQTGTPSEVQAVRQADVQPGRGLATHPEKWIPGAFSWDEASREDDGDDEDDEDDRKEDEHKEEVQPEISQPSRPVNTREERSDTGRDTPTDTDSTSELPPETYARLENKDVSSSEWDTVDPCLMARQGVTQRHQVDLTDEEVKDTEDCGSEQEYVNPWLSSGLELLVLMLMREMYYTFWWGVADAGGKFLVRDVLKLSYGWMLLKRFFLSTFFSLAGTGALTNNSTGLLYVIRGDLRPWHWVALSVAEIIAYCCAFMGLRLVYPPLARAFAPYRLKAGVSPWVGVCLEACLCFCSCMFKVITERWGKRAGTVANVLVVKVLLTLLGSYFTGACMNPTAATARAVVSGDLDNLFVYWLGPLLGCSLGALCQWWIKQRASRPLDNKSKAE